MKKLFIISVLALAAVVSCKKETPVKENSSTENSSVFYLTAALEQGKTRAELNSSLETVWKSGDEIGVYVTNRIEDNWDDIVTCSLNVADDGKTLGSFAIPSNYAVSDNRWNNFAFFPSGSAVMGAGTKPVKNVSFKLPVGYNNYYSGKFVLPLMANMRGEILNPSDISFSHVGGGVKITLNDIPANAHTASMTVTGQKITGETTAFPDLDPSKAGTEDGKLVATASTADDQTVNLNFTPGTIEDGVFIFPVPTIASDGNQKLVFNLWSNNDLLLWTRSASVPDGGIGRADLLEFGTAIELTEAKIKSTVIKKNDFYLIGNNVGAHSGDYDGDDYPFTNGKCIVNFAANGYVKVKAAGHEYMTDGYLQKTYYYVEIPTTIDDNSNGGAIITNGQSGNIWKTDDIPLGKNVKGNDYFITVNDGGYGNNMTNTCTTNKPSGYVFESHPGTTRFWVINNTAQEFTPSVHFWDATNTIDYTSWPGNATSSTTITPNSVTLYEVSTISNDDKLYIPTGKQSFTLSYNSDGTLTLSYEAATATTSGEDMTLDSTEYNL